MTDGASAVFAGRGHHNSLGANWLREKATLKYWWCLAHRGSLLIQVRIRVRVRIRIRVRGRGNVGLGLGRVRVRVRVRVGLGLTLTLALEG